MKKDIFIDTNIAKNFSNPLDPEYKKLYFWLMNEGFWVVNQKLLVEYGRTNQNLLVLLDRLTKSGRKVFFSKSNLDGFKFSKSTEKRLRSNIEDWPHIKTILLSDRKIGLIIDSGLRKDINQFPKRDGIKAQAFSRPQEIDYENWIP